VDEAHSIGALGPHGRGVCDFFGINPRSVDVLMGTFTKSFGAMGGYIAGKKEFIDKLKLRSHSAAYAETINPPVLGQILASMGSIMGIDFPTETSSSLGLHHHSTSSSSSVTTLTAGSASHLGTYTPQRLPANLLPTWLLNTLPPTFVSGAEGANRIRRLAFNSRYLHLALIKLGFLTYGHPASPIIPLMLFQPGKMHLFSRMMLQRRARVYGPEANMPRTGVGIPIAVVVVSYPATTLTTARVRFCISASHTKEDVDTLLDAVDEVGTLIGLKLSANVRERWTLEECKRRAVELVERGITC
jgi:serine palmitoyltransferase